VPRMRVGLVGANGGEYFRDAEVQGRPPLIDNVFRFTQAGSEVAALLGRMPSPSATRPTLPERDGQMPERITSTKKGRLLGAGDLRARRRLHRPGAATTFAHLSATHQSVAHDFRAGHLSGRRSAGVHVAHSLTPRILGNRATTTSRAA